MMSLKVVVYVGLLVCVIAHPANKGAIGFPEVEEDSRLKNKENRQPVYLPSTCPVNELYYPGDQKDDWICDCRPAYLYHPASDACWPAWQKGPCSDGQYLVLPQNSVIPVCQQNPCKVSGVVMVNGVCESLGSIKPCSHLYPQSAALAVNATNLKVECVALNLENRFGEKTSVVQPSCPPGAKRSVNGICLATFH